MGFVKYKEKENQIVVKAYGDDGKFIKSFFIPSKLYPLSYDNYKIFESSNTLEIKDEDILNLINTVKFKLAHCYTMSEMLLDTLKDYNIKSYSGWFFIGGQVPIFHSWCVLDDKYLIDLSNDHETITGYIKENYSEFSRDIYAKVSRLFMNMKNTDRIAHIGKVGEDFFYIGCEDIPNNARKTFRNLKKAYPNHESDLSVGGVGTLSPIQMEIMKN